MACASPPEGGIIYPSSSLTQTVILPNTIPLGHCPLSPLLGQAPISPLCHAQPAPGPFWILLAPGPHSNGLELLFLALYLIPLSDCSPFANSVCQHLLYLPKLLKSLKPRDPWFSGPVSTPRRNELMVLLPIFCLGWYNTCRFLK